MTPVDLLRRERRRRRVLQLSKRAGAWPLSTLITWFVLEAARRLAPDDPMPSLAGAAVDLLRAATDLVEPPPPLLLATAMEGVVARFLRDGDDRALLRDAVDLALAFDRRWAGSAGRRRGTRSGVVAHIEARAR